MTPAERTANYRARRKAAGVVETDAQRIQRRERELRYRRRRKERDPTFMADNNRRAKLRRPEAFKAMVKRSRLKNRDRFNSTRRAWRGNNIVKALVREARRRATLNGITFDLTADDVPPMGDVCPLFGVPFVIGGRSPLAPSLDRIDPKLGYIRGNVWVVGKRANTVKSDGTADEHLRIAMAMRRMLD